ncbi:amino acid adenylation domain-containing protein [Pseudonocardia spinosispora]|uniref:amino acid adenylation domain-containing protein n=1 Tax=Pseudonocardia spinosispora TaxID=103441 RepID=UPI000428BC68|nr:amino acid adenylation domain-containing protein [Pseudonocardia spinosispora]
MATRSTQGPSCAEAATGSATIVDRFERWAARAPESPAVVAGQQRLTYGELDARANRLARRLVAEGAGPERLVGVALPRSAELVVALLAVLKSGAAYLPVDPAYPTRRLEYVLADATPVALVSAPGVVVPDTGLPGLEIDGDGDPRPLTDAERLGPLRPDHPAYVIYTSGSTGQPKGVVVPHRCFLTLLDATVPEFTLGPDDVWTAFHSYAFDFSVWEFWGPLLTGGRTVVVPGEATWSAPDLLRLLADERVTLLSQTPSSFAAVDRADEAGEAGLEHLRLVVFGGEALEPSRLARWFARHGTHPRMVNMYGITETTVHVTAGDVDPAAQPLTESPIGSPLAGFRAHVLDPALLPVAAGQVGELYLGGDQLARGYLGRPGLTATRFVADPEVAGARLYRTGDLVRRAPTGAELTFIGRADAQLSLRGFRIEPGEVEAALNAWATVADSAVTVRADPDGSEGEQCLVAYVVPAGELELRSLRAHLSETLPSHLVPSHIVSLERLPLTPNRKLDRAALPPPAPRDDAAARRRALLRRRLVSRSTDPGGRTGA